MIRARASLSSSVGMLMEGALFLQFLLGMYTNLFVRWPSPAPGISGGMGQMMFVGTMAPLFMVHMMLGILLALGGVVALIMALLARQTNWETWTGLGLVGILVAGYGGLRFFYGGQHNSDSFTMAVGWLVASVAYFMGIRDSSV